MTNSTTCRECGSPLSSRSVAFHAVYCGQACRRRAQSRRSYLRRGAYGLRVCEVPGCGVTYRATDKDQRTCSRHCGWMLRWIEAGKPLSMPRLHGQHSDLAHCAHCRRPMQPRPNVVYCPTCAHDRARAGAWVDGVKLCSECGVPIDVYRGSGNLCGVCSDKKKRVYDREYRRATGGGNHRKRARFYGCEYEPVNRRRVFVRDGHRCHICGRKTTLKGKPWAPRRATLDHLIPLSRGGSHTYVNVACACFECNSKKSASVGGQGDQLLLLGE